MRIAIDIDSTLHHYWDELSDAAQRRFGVELPYDDQLTWRISRLRDEQLRVASPRRTPTRRSLAPSPTRTRSRSSTPGTTPATSSTSPATARSAATPPPRPGWRPSACSTTTCTAPTTRSAAASRWTSTSSSTTARSPWFARSSTASWRRRSCTRGTGSCREGGTSRAGQRAHDWPGLAAARRAPPAAPGRPAPPRDGRRDAHRRGARSPPPARPLRAHRPAPLPAGHRARAPGRRLGALGARRGRSRPHADRVLLPAVVPLRGRGRSSTCPAEGGALLVSNHSGALPPDARDDRQGDQGGAPAPAAAAPHRRALLQGLSRASRCCCPKIGARGRPPGQRPPPALRRGPARARLPGGPQGDREALQGPLPAAPLRPRRLRRGRDARRAPIVPIAVVGAEEAMPVFAQVGLLQRLTGLLYFPITPTLPALRAAGHARLPARQVPHPLPARRCRPTTSRSATSRGRTRRSCRPSPTRSAPRSRTSCSTCSASGAASGSDERCHADPRHRAVDVLGRPARAGARADPAVEAVIGVDRTPAEGRAGAHRVRPRDRLALAHPPHRRGGRDRHGRRHAARGRLGRHEPRAAPTRTTSSAR